MRCSLMHMRRQDGCHRRCWHWAARGDLQDQDDRHAPAVLMSTQLPDTQAAAPRALLAAVLSLQLRASSAQVTAAEQVAEDMNAAEGKLRAAAA